MTPKPSPLVREMAASVTPTPTARQASHATTVQLRARQAVESLSAGTAVPADLSILVAAYNFSAAVAMRFGLGREHADLLHPWRAAVLAVAEGEGRDLGETHLAAIRAGLDLHDAQLQEVTQAEVAEVGGFIRRHSVNAMLLPAPQGGPTA